MEIEDYIKLYGKIWKEVNDWTVNTSIQDVNSTEICNAILQEICKDRRMDQIDERNSEKSERKEPTEKQMKYLKYLTSELGESMPKKENITRKDASELIDDYKEEVEG